MGAVMRAEDYAISITRFVDGQDRRLGIIGGLDGVQESESSVERADSQSHIHSVGCPYLVNVIVLTVAK